MTESLSLPYYEERKAVSNWRLRVGSVLILLILVTAFLGPLLAPKDPLQEHFVAFLDDNNYIKAPFPAFTVPGFLLGSDEFGRDVFSRILWGIKPTLMLTIVSAAIRLILGTIIGIMAGFKQNRISKLSSGLISVSVSLPVIFIALCVIAAGGQKMGVWAFVLGVTITGWGDAAQLVRDQTRIIASQLYIEASKALGSSGKQQLFIHFIPQIISSVWMLLAFEVSTCMLVIAELGVLGYFTNAVWIPIGDWVALRSSGMPELSQMLSELQKQPWSALGASFFVVISILGFNLIGEGLRYLTSPEQSRLRKSRLSALISFWVDERLFSPQATIVRSAPTIAAILFLLALSLGGGIFIWRMQTQKAIESIPPLPGNHQWVTAYRDSQGTLWVPHQAAQEPELAWEVNLGSKMTAGPVVDSEGVIYSSTMDGFLHAVSPEGKLLWRASLPNVPIGVPALSPNGRIYVADQLGGLTSVAKSDSLKEIIEEKSPRSPSLSGPLVASDGTIYHITTDYIYAISSSDEIIWKQPIPTYSYTSPSIRLTTDGLFLLFEDFIFKTQNGDLLIRGTPDPTDRFIIGSNGQVYLLTQAFLEKVDLVNPDTSRDTDVIRWDSRALGTNFRFPSNAGITPEGYIWLHFGGTYENNRIVWLTPEGISLNILDFPYRRYSIIIAIDSTNSIIFCGNLFSSPINDVDSDCRYNPFRTSAPAWVLPIDGTPVGGALINNGRIIISTSAGKLISFEESQ